MNNNYYTNSNSYTQKSYNLLDQELIHGTFSATISEYQEFPALIDHDNTIIRDSFIQVTLNLSNNQFLETRWYSKRLNYIMTQLNRQLSEVTYKLSDLLEKLRTTPFTVTISIDPKYGYQVDYK